MGNKILILLLICIIFLGGFLRTYRLDKAPPSVNWDEASYAYNAYSLWLTGKDEYGTRLPTSIRSFDDYKPPLYAYLTAPIVGMFGLSEFTARIVSAFFGTLTLLLIFIFGSYATKRTSIGLVASFVFATAPEIVHFSRLGFEAVLALPLMLVGLVFFLRHRVFRHAYQLGLFFFMLSAFAYNSHKVYLLLGVLWILLKLKRSFFTVSNIFICGFILTPFILTSLFTPALARFSSTSIFPLYNKSESLYYFAGEIVNRYIGYFSPANIFVRGTNEPGQQVINFSVFFPFLSVAWIAGLIALVKYRSRFKFLWYWLLLSPLPAVITWNWFTPIRVLPHWAIVCIVISLGIEYLFSALSVSYRRVVVVFTLFWWSISIIWSYHAIQYSMPFLQYGRWQWGFRETLRTIQPILNQYDTVVWDTPQAQPYIFVLFYLSYSPTQYFSEIDSVTKSGAARTVYDFGKFQFRKIYWPVDRDKKHTLFIGDPYALPDADLQRDRVHIIDEIRTPEEYILYRIVGT